MVDKISTPQLNNDANYLADSTWLIQVAIIMNVMLPLIYLALNNRIYNLLGSGSLLLISNLIILPVIHFVSSCLVLVGICRIVYIVKSKVPIFYLIAAIITFAFFFALKGLYLWHGILLISGGGYSESELQYMGLLILFPLGIISCCAIALRANLQFRFKDGSKQIYILSIVIGLMWLLSIIFGWLLWWQNRQAIVFHLRWLTSSNTRWQMQSRFGCFYNMFYYLSLLLWQIWLYISLRSARCKLRRPNDCQN